MEEIWKDIQGYEGLYQVSNLGSVKRIPHIRYDKNYYLNEYMLPYRKKENGYLIVSLNKNNKCKKMYIHRLVAQTFIPNPNNLPQVNHKDENKENNRVDNLEWCTAKYNRNYNHLNKKYYKKIYQYSLDNIFLREFNSHKEAKQFLGISQNRGDLSYCVKGKQKTAFGYIWKNKKEN